jgi:hypothetical protein
MFSIRRATAADYAQICALYAQVDELHERAVPQVFTPSGSLSRPLDFILDAMNRDDNALLVAEEAEEGGSVRTQRTQFTFGGHE